MARLQILAAQAGQQGDDLGRVGRLLAALQVGRLLDDRPRLVG